MKERPDITAIKNALRVQATAQLRAMSNEDLELHAIGLVEMLEVCKAEYDRRALEWLPAAGSA